MDTRKASELEIIQEIQKDSYMMVQTNEGVKRISADKVGKVKTVNETEPDENGNIDIKIPECKVKTVNEKAPDEKGNIEIEVGVRSWEELEGKPFGEEVTKTNVLEWDGDVTGKEYVAISDYILICKMSDDIIDITSSDIEGWELTMSVVGEVLVTGTTYTEGEDITVSLTADDFRSSADAGAPFLMMQIIDPTTQQGVMIVPEDIVASEDVPISIPKGLYFTKQINDIGEYDSNYMYVKSIKATSPIFGGGIKKLDNKYIDAEWMAKEEVTTKNTNTLEWNGDITDKETLDVMGDGTIVAVKITSECNVDGSDLVGCVVTIVNESNQEEITLEITSQEELVNPSQNSDVGYMYMATDNNTICFLVANEDVDMDGVVFSEGVWFFRCDIGSTIVHTSSVRATSNIFTLETTTATPLPEKFIPKSIARVEDITWESLLDKPFKAPTFKYEWDGNTEGLVSVGDKFYKISDDVLTIEQCKGATFMTTVHDKIANNMLDKTFIVGTERNDCIKEYDGGFAICIETSYLDIMNMVTVYNEVDSFYIITEPNTIINEYTFPEIGIYFSYTQDNPNDPMIGYSHTILFTDGKELPLSVIPDTVATKEWVEQLILGGAW